MRLLGVCLTLALLLPARGAGADEAEGLAQCASLLRRARRAVATASDDGGPPRPGPSLDAAVVLSRRAVDCQRARWAAANTSSLGLAAGAGLDVAGVAGGWLELDVHRNRGALAIGAWLSMTRLGSAEADLFLGPAVGARLPFLSGVLELEAGLGPRLLLSDPLLVAHGRLVATFGWAAPGPASTLLPMGLRVVADADASASRGARWQIGLLFVERLVWD